MILNGHIGKAEQVIAEWKEIFSGRLLVELEIGYHTSNQRGMLLDIGGDLYSAEQSQVNKELIKIAGKLNLPMIVTNDVHYGLPEHQSLHDLALCIQTNTPRSSEKRFSFKGLDCHLANIDWMTKRCKTIGIPEEAISNTAYVADMVDDKSYLSDQINRLPTYKDTPEGLTSWEYLEIEAQNGLWNRFNGMPPKEYRERLDYELKSLKKMGFSDYILIVAQVIEESWRLKCIPGAGRGSSAGSLVCWAMGITQIDPIKYGLFYERFVNYGRSAIPKIFNEKIKSELSEL